MHSTVIHHTYCEGAHLAFALLAFARCQGLCECTSTHHLGWETINNIVSDTPVYLHVTGVVKEEEYSGVSMSDTGVHMDTGVVKEEEYSEASLKIP